MGFASRSVSIIRYRVKGEMEGSFWDAVDSGLKRGAFHELDTPGELVGIGWTSIDDFADNTFGRSVLCARHKRGVCPARRHSEGSPAHP